MRSLIAGVSVLILFILFAVPASADPSAQPVGLFSKVPSRNPWRIDWSSSVGQDAARSGAPALRLTPIAFQQQDEQPLHAAAVEHSDAYQMRAKIHKYASFATLPLLAAELALGQSLYNTPANAGGKRSLHAAVGAGIVGLFAVNTVTGAWNLFGSEGWNDKEGRTLRLVHGLLMMAADAGFVATTASGPNSEGRRGALTFETDKVTHRNIAIASISVGTAGYLMMLFVNH